MEPRLRIPNVPMRKVRAAGALTGGEIRTVISVFAAGGSSTERTLRRTSGTLKEVSVVERTKRMQAIKDAQAARMEQAIRSGKKALAHVSL